MYLSRFILVSRIIVKAALPIFSNFIKGQGDMLCFPLLPWHCMGTLFKHTWLTNDSVSSDMSRKSRFSEFCFKRKERWSGRGWEWQKKTGQYSPLLFCLHPTGMWHSQIVTPRVTCIPQAFRSKHISGNVASPYWKHLFRSHIMNAGGSEGCIIYA